jgi:hypothetical protein
MISFFAIPGSLLTYCGECGAAVPVQGQNVHQSYHAKMARIVRAARAIKVTWADK